MVIGRGKQWGEVVERPIDLVVVDSDADLATILSAGSGVPVTVHRGDLCRTMGLAPGQASPLEMRRFEIDMISVVADTRPHVSVAHVIAHEPWWRGSWWRGTIVMVMNVQFFGEWDVISKGHPNDGRVEILQADHTLSVRDRIEARRRIRSSTHLPHPSINTSSARQCAFEFTHRLVIRVDGRRIGRCRRLSVEVVPDAGAVYL